VGVHCRNVAEGLRTIAVSCDTLPVYCSALRKRCKGLWTVAVCCGNVAEGLQTIVVLYGACGASSAPCGGVHHILSPRSLIAVHYGNVTVSLRTTGTLADHCGALRCMVHYGALRKRCGSLADHWNASKPLWFTTTHCGASSTRCGGVHHTLTETPKFHRPPLIIRLIHKSL